MVPAEEMAAVDCDAGRDRPGKGRRRFACSRIDGGVPPVWVSADGTVTGYPSARPLDGGFAVLELPSLRGRRVRARFARRCDQEGCASPDSAAWRGVAGLITFLAIKSIASIHHGSPLQTPSNTRPCRPHLMWTELMQPLIFLKAVFDATDLRRYRAAMEASCMPKRIDDTVSHAERPEIAAARRPRTYMSTCAMWMQPLSAKHSRRARCQSRSRFRKASTLTAEPGAHLSNDRWIATPGWLILPSITGDDHALSIPPIARATMLIRRPVAEVFNAFVDPAVTTLRFWFSRRQRPARARRHRDLVIRDHYGVSVR